MPSHDLAGGVAHQLLAAAVPARHASIRVHHPDGIVPGFLDQEPEALFAFTQLLGGPLCVVVQMAQMALAQPGVNQPRRLDRLAPQPVKRQHRRDLSFVAFQYAPDLLPQQAAHRARRREQRFDGRALTLRLVELTADHTLDETLVVRERALGIAFGQLLEKVAQEWNGHPAQRLTHPRKLVGRRVELYRFGPTLGYPLEVRKQAARDFRHQIAFAVAEGWLL